MPFDVMAALRWVAGLALACLLFFGGRSCGQADSADVIAGKDQALRKAAAALQAASVSLEASGEALHAVNAETARAEAEAAALAERAARAHAEAEQARRDFEIKQGAIEAELERAKRDPGCRAILESQACAVIH